jgi:anti-sigma factor RsiW
MNCHKAERLISDDLDGALPAKALRRLTAHLAACPACRRYKEQLELVQAGAAARAEAPFAPGYLDDLSARLRRRLEALGAGERPPHRVSRGWRWVWLAVPVAAAAAFIFLQVFQESPTGVLDLLTDEASYGAIGQAADDSAELTAELNSVVLNSIQDEVPAVSPEEVPSLVDDPAFLDSLSEEEAALIDQEIAEELKS